MEHVQGNTLISGATLCIWLLGGYQSYILRIVYSVGVASALQSIIQLACRQDIINSSASAPLNATKIAVQRVSDVDVCMFGPEL